MLKSAKLEARLKELESKNSQLQKQVGDSKSASSAQVISRNSSPLLLLIGRCE